MGGPPDNLGILFNVGSWLVWGDPPCYGRLAFVLRIVYIQDLPGAAFTWRQRAWGRARPFSQERLRTLRQRENDTVDLRWFLFDESYLCLWQPSPSQDLQFWTSHLSSVNFYLKPEMGNWSGCWYQVRKTCSSKNFGCSKRIRKVARYDVETPSIASWRQSKAA